MKIAGISRRLTTVPLGLMLAAASGWAGGSAAWGQVTSNQATRAAALRLVLNRGAISWLPQHDGRAGLALPAGVPSVPEPGTSSTLNGVFCATAVSCWAVGEYRSPAGANLNEAIRWNGSKWSRVSVPSPGGTASGDISQLTSVRCITTGNCWAVGIAQPNGGGDLSQALHWNGRKWSVVPTPEPGGTVSGDINTLFDVACQSPANCWAAGEYGSQSGGILLLNQALHWNGRKWSLVPAPEPGGTGHGDFNALGSIRCRSASSCLAVGTYGTLGSTVNLLNEALRWNGSAWSQVVIPSPGGTSDGAFSQLVSLACTSSSNCWAAGAYGSLSPSETFLNQVLHWNGTSWSVGAVPEPDGTAAGASQQLASVTCNSATNCWAVGNYGTIGSGSGRILNQALRWDGAAWSVVDTPEPGGAATGDSNRLDGVRCTSSGNCWAVGQDAISGASFINQALHWNGTRWSSR